MGKVAALPADEFLKPVNRKHRIKTRQFSDFQTKFSVENCDTIQKILYKKLIFHED